MANDGEIVVRVTVLLGSQISADSDCSHEIKIHFLLGRRYDKPRQDIKKQRDYFANKSLYSQTYGFSSSYVWMWVLNHKEGLKNWCFELQCWRRLLRVLWIARRSNQSILKKINPEYSSQVLMQKLKLQYFSHLMRRTDSLEKTLMLGKIEGRKRREQQRMNWQDGTTDSMDMSLSKLQEMKDRRPGMLQSMGSQRVRHEWAN